MIRASLFFGAVKTFEAVKPFIGLNTPGEWVANIVLLFIGLSMAYLAIGGGRK